MYFAYYSKLKNMWLGKICIKHLKFASLMLLRVCMHDYPMSMFHLMDKQVAGILAKTHPKCIKTYIFSGEISRTQRRGDGPDRIYTVPNLGKTLAFSNQKHERNKPTQDTIIHFHSVNTQV